METVAATRSFGVDLYDFEPITRPYLGQSLKHTHAGQTSTDYLQHLDDAKRSLRICPLHHHPSETGQDDKAVSRAQTALSADVDEMSVSYTEMISAVRPSRSSSLGRKS